MSKPCGCTIIKNLPPSLSKFPDDYGIVFCPLHAAAGKMRDLLQRVKERADLIMYLAPSTPRPLYIELAALLETITKTKGENQ